MENIEQIAAESERKRREKQAFAKACDGFVVIKMDGIMQPVDPTTISVDGESLLKVLHRLSIAEQAATDAKTAAREIARECDAKINALQLQVQGNTALIKSVVATLKGVKL